jgi:hypothetical protein
LAVRRQTAVIFDDNMNFVLRAEFAQPPQSIRRQFLLLFITAFALGVDADDFAAQKLRGFDPAIVIFYRLSSFSGVGVAQRAFAVAHNQAMFDA